MPEQRAETEREAARRAGRGTLSHIDEHAMSASEDARRERAAGEERSAGGSADPARQDARRPRKDPSQKGGTTGGV